MSTTHRLADPGPIRVSPDGRYFVYQNGEPFFWLGDTQWELLRSFTFDDAGAILEDRKSKGFSVIQVMSTGFDDGSGSNLAGQTPWMNNDPGIPNEKYFKHVDSVIQLGCEKELVFALGVFHQVQASHITPANARMYAKWLAYRYRNAPNIIWAMYPKARQEFVPVIRELAAGLREGDGGAHIITVHPDPSPASSSFIHNESWLDFNSIQTWKNVELIYPMVTGDYNLHPVKPVVMAEGVYEGGVEYGFEVTPLWLRRQAYYTYLAGGHHSYGHRTYTYLARGHHSHKHDDSYSGRVLPMWKDALDAPGAIPMGVVKGVLLARKEWWNLVPDQSVFANVGSPTTRNVGSPTTRKEEDVGSPTTRKEEDVGSPTARKEEDVGSPTARNVGSPTARNVGSPTARKGKNNRTLNVAARSATGEWILAYLGSSTTVSINMDKISAGNMIKASWIDPVTGAGTEIGSFTNTGTRSFATPASWEDAVLLLEAREDA